MIGIYKITSPSNKIYIGQSVNIDKRKQSYKGLYSGVLKQPKISNSIIKYKWENHIFEIIEECDVENLDDREQYWKLFYLKLNNMDWNKVLFMNIQDGLAGPKSKEWKDSRKKKILQYDLEGNFLREWDSANDFSIFKGLSNGTTVTKCCKGKGKSAYGFIWKYKLDDNYPQKIDPVFRDWEKKKITQYDKNNNFIKDWNSVLDAGLIFNNRGQNINNNLRGITKTAHGFIWKYNINN